ncbi:radical SAM family heme chaperone HemW [uncultured Ruthenibacterium sp.]|uniref:radical SAM family heme chaperone HemW n=1 Tax=uncultured Ruthenibacterium sp. TaxID=1905347 RepID=UPI00349E6947
MFGLYVHIPYCASKCRYCDFYSAAGNHNVPDSYVDALCREMDRFSPCGSTPLRPDTLYFGGGTPSLLTAAQLARLIDTAGPVAGAEITLEANPETVSKESLVAYRQAGVNRISFGVQSAFDVQLARLGRRHTAAQSRLALQWAREVGFVNISGDLMLALPDYTLDELKATVELLCEGGCTHISSYLLKIEPNTVFGRRPPENLPDEDAAADFYLAAVELLEKAGYGQYEISNFSKPGFEGRHNLNYWNCADYLGLGPAAHSCMGGKRFYTPAGTAAFCEKPAEYVADGACTAEDFIMLQLRLTSGLNLETLKQAYGVVWDEKKFAFAQRLQESGLARFDGHTLALTPRGMLLQNSILVELI